MSSTGADTRRNRVAYLVIGLFVAICAAGWAIIVVHSEGTPGITPQIVSWQVADRSVRVHYQIAKSKGADVSCALIAYDVNHAEVGRTEVTVPSGTGDVDRHQELPTRTRATAVDVQGCRAG
jgi:hypothetical protein